MDRTRDAHQPYFWFGFFREENKEAGARATTRGRYRFSRNANDSAAVREAGGLRLVRDAPVELLQEDLTISATQIDVSYVFWAFDSLSTASIVALSGRGFS